MNKGIMNKGNQFSLLLVLFCSLIILPVTGFASSGSDVLYFEYGDNFDPAIIDAKGNIYENGPEFSQLTLVLYLSPTCGSCISTMKNYNKIQSIFLNEPIDFLVIFENSLPYAMLDKYGIPIEQVATVNSYKLSLSVPTFFIIDENGKVLFRANDMSIVIEKLYSMDTIFSKDRLRNNANNYLHNLFASNRKKTVVYFSMRGCEDCRAADNILDNDLEILDIYDIIRIYDVPDLLDQSALVDDFKIFSRVYEIDWYPTFLIFDNAVTEIIRQVPLTQLKETLLDATLISKDLN